MCLLFSFHRYFVRCVKYDGFPLFEKYHYIEVQLEHMLFPRLFLMIIFGIVLLHKIKETYFIYSTKILLIMKTKKVKLKRNCLKTEFFIEKNEATSVRA